jgi:hypothetical protein
MGHTYRQRGKQQRVRADWLNALNPQLLKGFDEE